MDEINRVLGLYQAGQTAAAIAACEDAYARGVAPFQMASLLGQMLEASGRPLEAAAAYGRAIPHSPGVAFPATRRSLILLRHHWGAPPPPRPLAADVAARGDVVSMSCLGGHGRFGNQIFQYAHLRLRAAAHGLTALAPDWIGRDLFAGADDPLITGPSPPLLEEAEGASTPDMSSPRGRDLKGFHQYHTRHLAPSRAAFQALFTPSPAAAAALQPVMDAVRTKGRQVVAIHLRRGDFGHGRFWLAPTDWYRDWLTALWPTLSAPVLWVATDDARVLDELRDFAPLHADALTPAIPGAEFLIDFHMLTQADVVAISNSSFSFAATLLNTRARSFLRPVREAARLAPYDPWDSPPLL